MKELIKKVINKETISYVVFGVLTTVINIVVFNLCEYIMDYKVANVIAWIAAVAFAFVTNKLYVFESKSWEIKLVGKEAARLYRSPSGFSGGRYAVYDLCRGIPAYDEASGENHIQRIRNDYQLCVQQTGHFQKEMIKNAR